jgi:hypothetical protein
MLDLSTNITGLFNYQLNAFLDPNAKNVVSGMSYSNYALQNCSVQLIQIQLAPQGSLETDVHHLKYQLKYRSMYYAIRPSIK